MIPYKNPPVEHLTSFGWSSVSHSSLHSIPFIFLMKDFFLNVESIIFAIRKLIRTWDEFTRACQKRLKQSTGGYRHVITPTVHHAFFVQCMHILPRPLFTLPVYLFISLLLQLVPFRWDEREREKEGRLWTWEMISSDTERKRMGWKEKEEAEWPNRKQGLKKRWESIWGESRRCSSVLLVDREKTHAPGLLSLFSLLEFFSRLFSRLFSACFTSKTSPHV